MPLQQITLPLKEFLDLLLGDPDRRRLYSRDTIPWRLVPNSLAEHLLKLDPTENYIHVEFPSIDNGNTDCTVWWAKDWATEYENYKRKKELAHLERQVSVCITELADKVCRSLANLTGMEYKVALPYARRMAVGRMYDKIGLMSDSKYIEDLKKADNDLQEWKEKYGREH